jgi:hypothetical protein
LEERVVDTTIRLAKIQELATAIQENKARYEAFLQDMGTKARTPSLKGKEVSTEGEIAAQAAVVRYIAK